jgi:hypothetical protein
VTSSVESALLRAIGFLERAQLPSGEFRIFTSLLPDMADEGTIDPSVFPTALMVHSLTFSAGTEAIRERALDFLEGQRDPGGLWRHWTRDHSHFKTLPADVDDTCCVSSVLAQAGRTGADPRLLLANRDARGRFLTWFIPRWSWRGLRHARVTWPHLLHPVILFFFFRQTSAAPRDVDAGVNANALHYLGTFAGHQAVVDYLLAILRDGSEADADKWYDSRFVLWYLFARALVPLTPDAAPLLLARLRADEPQSALERALAIATRLTCGDALSGAVLEPLLSEQASNGSWRRAAVYFGGRERRRDGTLAPAHPDTPRWGSEELTTCFAVEALARWLRLSSEST